MHCAQNRQQMVFDFKVLQLVNLKIIKVIRILPNFDYTINFYGIL